MQSTWAALGPEATLDTAWRQRAACGGVALIWDGKPVGAAVLEHAVQACAHWLHGEAADRPARVRPGDRVAMMMENGPGLIAAFLACQRLGAVAVALSPRSTPQRTEQLLQDSGACCVIIDGGLPQRQRALHEAQSYAALLRCMPAQWPCDPPAPPPACEHGPGDCAFIQYTSGSTGESKGVMISHRSALLNMQAFCHAMQVRRGETFSSMLPLWHDMGLLCFGLAPLLLGCPLVLHRAEALSLRAWLEGMARHGVNVTGAPDSLLAVALRVIPHDDSPDLGSLRLLVCGSEPVQRDTIEGFAQRWGLRGRIKPAYGMAELTLCATMTRPEADWVCDAQGQVSCGTSIDGVELRIAGAAGTHEAGEILVRSPSRLMAYWGRPEASAELVDAQGFVRTGDLGYLDPAGRLFVLGRVKNLLVRGGEKHSPHVLESAAQRVAQVRRAAVIQIDDAQAHIVALIETERRLLHDASALDTLARTLRRAMHDATGLSPDELVFLPAGGLPVTDNGKLQHARLRREWAAGTWTAARTVAAAAPTRPMWPEWLEQVPDGPLQPDAMEQALQAGMARLQAQLRLERGLDDPIPSAIWEALLRHGLARLTVPRAWGGCGASTVAYCRCMQSLGRLGPAYAMTAVPHLCVGVGSVCLLAAPPWRERVLRGVVEQAQLVAFAITEDRGSDLGAMQTRIDRDAQGRHRLHGTKQWVTNLARARHSVVAARHGQGMPPGSSLLLLDLHAPGVRAHAGAWTKRCANGSDTGTLYLDDVALEDSQWLGPPGQGMALFQALVQGGRLAAACALLGMAEAAAQACGQPQRSPALAAVGQALLRAAALLDARPDPLQVDHHLSGLCAVLKHEAGLQAQALLEELAHDCRRSGQGLPPALLRARHSAGLFRLLKGPGELIGLQGLAAWLDLRLPTEPDMAVAARWRWLSKYPPENAYCEVSLPPFAAN
jgi:acyl-CoA synthetase (AMP-forming)/AMP-acid ligase II/alkylation response protein AidB-like acyl-CoA dehydrogenase